MEVCVRTYVEELNGHKRLINVAYLVMVALDENERPVAVSYTHLDVYKRQGILPDWAGVSEPGLSQAHFLHDVFLQRAVSSAPLP